MLDWGRDHRSVVVRQHSRILLVHPRHVALHADSRLDRGRRGVPRVGLRLAVMLLYGAIFAVAYAQIRKETELPEPRS